MTNYDQIPHVCCGGNLTFEKTQVEWLILNAKQLGVAKKYDDENDLLRIERMLKYYGREPKIKTVIKNLYRCDKCNDLVNVISCPSWEKYVLMGKIRVEPHIYRIIKRNRKDGILRF